MKINEQIFFLRKQKGITQDDLAQALGVTNQSVSKWESGACCPDIQLLPALAEYFDVSVDELLGYKPAESFSNVYLKIKELFMSSPKEESFSIAFRLGSLLHEGAAARGYKGYVPWNTDKKIRMAEEDCRWGFSATSEPEGITVHRANSVFITDNKLAKPIKPSEVRDIHALLTALCDRDTLKVLFAIYEMTFRDYDVFVSAEQISDRCRLAKEDVSAALDNLPIQIEESEDGQMLYRIEGCYMHVPSLLMMFRDK